MSKFIILSIIFGLTPKTSLSATVIYILTFFYTFPKGVFADSYIFRRLNKLISRLHLLVVEYAINVR
jgi:hypothetical protein